MDLSVSVVQSTSFVAIIALILGVTSTVTQKLSRCVLVVRSKLYMSVPVRFVLCLAIACFNTTHLYFNNIASEDNSIIGWELIFIAV